LGLPALKYVKGKIVETVEADFAEEKAVIEAAKETVTLKETLKEKMFTDWLKTQTSADAVKLTKAKEKVCYEIKY